MENEKIKIMIVEDEAIVALEIKEKLLLYGYDVPVTIRSGEKVLATALTHKPDVILMDIKLKGETNGIEASHLLNSHIQIPIVFLTSYGDKETLIKAKKINPYGYIIKPFQDQELLATIEMAINRFRVEKALEQSRNYFSTTLQSIGDGVITTDTKGIITFINHVAQELTGWEGETSIGEDIRTVFKIFNGETMEPVDNPVFEVLESGIIVGLVNHTILVSKKGETYPIDDSGAPIKDNCEQIIGVVLVFRDISEKKKAEAEKRKLEENLRQAEKMEAIGQLSAGIAHDFNNQLTGIQMFAELITSETGNKQIKEYTQSILSLVEHSTNLTKQLLAFSQKGKYQVHTIDLHDIINEVVAILKRSIDKRIRISLELNALSSHIACDPTLIQNALLNLALNARDAIIEKNGTITFSTKNISLEEGEIQEWNDKINPGAYISLEVIDTGIGMDHQVIQHIFEPFFTTKERGEGTGMGLAAVYGTIKNHNGTISVKSSRNEGSTFTVLLPLSNKKPGSEEACITSPVKRTKAHVIYVEDEEMLRVSVTYQLERWGFLVTTYENGKKAIEEYKTTWQETDIVLLDMIMPEIDGKETFVGMRKINPDIKAIILSGYYTDEEIQKCIELGAKGFLKKPFTGDALLMKIKSIL